MSRLIMAGVTLTRYYIVRERQETIHIFEWIEVLKEKMSYIQLTEGYSAHYRSPPETIVSPTRCRNP